MLPIKKIQKWLKDNNKDIFLINRTDQFLSEYISKYAERLKWISNFSGSAGRAIIEIDVAYIFVDGRYTNQAITEVDETYFTIKHLSDYWSHLKRYKGQEKIISLDATLHSIVEVEKIKKIFYSFNSLNFLDINPIDLNWKDQPKQPHSKAFLHEIKYAGEDSSLKLKKVQKILSTNNIDYFFLSSLDSIAWILNIRGDDIENTPLLCCYIIIPKEGNIELFIDRSKINHLLNNLKNTVNLNDIENISQFIASLNVDKIFGLDENYSSYHFKYLCLNCNIKTKHLENPCIYPKAQKNRIELRGAKKANIRDGVSITKFLYWLKNKMKINEMNELKAAEYLLNLRIKNDLYHSPSFETISAFGFHAALPHYRVDYKSNLSFKNNSIYLVDSGAQYKDGTTDITRTIIIGTPTEEQVDRFTRVLKGHIAIAQAKFSHNTRGSELDYLARKSLQEINCDYDHGTGHGIGSFLSVHEGPQKISKFKSQSDSCLKEGMIISNEPGYYKENEYGIRIENLLICFNSDKKESESLYFETISWAPIDLELVSPKLLNKNEIDWLNNYHKKVYKNISPNLSVEEKKWLKYVTKSI